MFLMKETFRKSYIKHIILEHIDFISINFSSVPSKCKINIKYLAPKRFTVSMNLLKVIMVFR